MKNAVVKFRSDNKMAEESFSSTIIGLCGAKGQKRPVVRNS
jgi:hypothetical protein